MMDYKDDDYYEGITNLYKVVNNSSKRHMNRRDIIYDLIKNGHSPESAIKTCDDMERLGIIKIRK